MFSLIKIRQTRTHKHINILGIKFKFKNEPNIYIEEGNSVEISPYINKKKLKLSVCGKNNTIIIKNIAILEKLSISVYAENSTLIIDENTGFRKGQIIMGADNANAGLLKNAKVKIGKRVSVEGVFIGAWCGNTELTIGDDCMLSNGITIFNADSHPIYKKGTKEIINRSEDLHIGNHVWIGKDVTILKNVEIPDNCIVGYGSLVTKKFEETNCVIAGNPAKVIKHDVDWHMNGSGDYIENRVL